MKYYRFLILAMVLIIFSAWQLNFAYAEPAQPELLKVGSEGESVVALQMRLKDLGYYNYKVTAYYGSVTADAVRSFQEKNGLSVDGVVGQQTFELLYSTEAIRYTPSPSQVSGLLPISRGGSYTLIGTMVDWFSSGQYIFRRGDTAKVTDVNTRISFYMKRTGGSYHADCEPISKADANKIKQIWGGWSWKRRAVIVEVNGARIAASMHGMPHAYDFIANNGMQGHVCIHFYKSRTHIHNSQDPDHQAMVRKAAGK